MFVNYKRYGIFVFTLLLLIAVSYLFYLDFRISNRGFTFAMLDVGQGDALFIESPTGTQVLLDGGPSKKILNELRRVMSPFDRRIDAIIITNPDQDHIAGFMDVLDVYEVGMVFEPGTLNDSKTFQNLKNEIKSKNIPNILARKGMRLDLGGGAKIDVLFPDRDVRDSSTNDGSVVARLSYGEISVMLAGDSTVKTEKIILAGNPPALLASTILKVGHHGSRTSTGASFVQAVSPRYALISAGKSNKYGHPHKDILQTLDRFGVKILRTDVLGTIILSCDKIGACETN